MFRGQLSCVEHSRESETFVNLFMFYLPPPPLLPSLSTDYSRGLLAIEHVMSIIQNYGLYGEREKVEIINTQTI